MTGRGEANIFSEKSAKNMHSLSLQFKEVSNAVFVLNFEVEATQHDNV
jgi:hypothetical protein